MASERAGGFQGLPVAGWHGPAEATPRGRVRGAPAFAEALRERHPVIPEVLDVGGSLFCPTVLRPRPMQRGRLLFPGSAS